MLETEIKSKKIPKSELKFEELPDTITPLDYAKWRGIGGNNAREIFNSKGFPRLPGTGVKQLADKRAVFLYELGLRGENLQTVLNEIGKELVRQMIVRKEEKNEENREV